MVVALTDGLWEFMCNEECIGMAVHANEPRISVDALFREAKQRWMKEEQVVDDDLIEGVFPYISTVGGYHRKKYG